MHLDNTKKANTAKLLKNRKFMCYLMGQSISGLGDTFQTIATASLILSITGSGMSAGFGMICAPLPSLLLSPLAGYMGDKFREKNILILLDFLRGGVALLFTLASGKLQVYTLLLLLSCLGIFYGPSNRKIVVTMLKDKDVATANSLLSGASGVVYLVGPVAAGVLVGIYGTGMAFYINGISFFFSAIIFLFIKSARKVDARSKIIGGNTGGVLDEIKAGFVYCRGSAAIRSLVMTTTVLCFVGASVNMVFYPFAFDILRVNSKGWGVMLSILYGTNLIAFLLPSLLRKNINSSSGIFIYAPLLIVCTAWLVYGMTRSLALVLLMLTLEGIASTVCGIFLGTKLQLETQKSFLARVMAANDVFNSCGKLCGIALSLMFTAFFSIGQIFIINSILLMLFSLYMLLTASVRSHRSSYNLN